MKIKKTSILFIMMVGIPGSGKTHNANSLSNQYPCSIHSSDSIRDEKFGGKYDKVNNKLVFEKLHQSIIKDLQAGKSTICDATNIYRHYRDDLLDQIKDIDCQKICVVMETPYNVCFKRNSRRNKVVPDDKMKEMHNDFEMPQEREGWDKIFKINSSLPHQEEVVLKWLRLQ